MKIKGPEQSLKHLYRITPIQFKAAFFSSLTAGLMAHLYQFTNKLYNFDTLYNTPGEGAEGLTLGRFGLYLSSRLIGRFFGNYSLPLVDGMISLLLIAISACLIIYILRVEGVISSGLIGALLSVYPSVTCSFFYIYTSSYYCLALLLSCLSVFFILKKKNVLNFGIAVIMLAFSIGIYQSYLAISSTLVLTYLIILCTDSLNSDAKDNKCNLQSMLISALYCLVYLFSGLISYLAITKLSLVIYNTTLSEYQGLSSIGKVDIPHILRMIRNSYIHTLHLMTENVDGLNPTAVIKSAIILLFVIFLFLSLSIIKKGLSNKNNYLLIIMFVIFLGIFPISLFLAYVMSNPDTFVYSIMLNSVVFSIILPIAMLDHMTVLSEDIESTGNVHNSSVADNSNNNEKEPLTAAKTHLIGSLNISNWIAFLSVLSMILVYIWYANGNYLRMQYTNFHDIAYYTVIMDQIKSIDGYDDELPVIVLGHDIADKTNNAGSLIGDKFNLYGASESNVSAYSANNLFTKYLGFTPEFLWSDEDEERFWYDPRVLEMPCYPDDGSIKLIDGVIVVKLEEAPGDYFDYTE